MKRFSAFSVFFAAVLVLLGVAGSKPLWAQDREGREEEFSAYSVARLKLFEGTAWVRMPDMKEWEEFATNSPIPEKSRISIPEGSEAELQFHGGQFVLLTGGTEIDVRRFDEELSSFRLRMGEIRFDLPPEDFSPARVAVPDDGKVNFPVPGRYWVIVQEDGRSRLVVRSGEAVVTYRGNDVRVRSGQAATIDEEIRVSAYSGPGDERYEAPPPLYGEEAKVDAPPAAVRELGEYGDWVYSRDYGYVWRPMVAEGWSPYYYGRWIWVFPFGWSWLSYEPWGWYPYHYGWWVVDPAFGWVWCPYRSFVTVDLTFGRTRVRHFHRGVRFYPGTVRFVREGGDVRWVPLRPGERFVRFGIQRSDSRLARWEKPLVRSSIFFRAGDDRRGKAEWRDWSAPRKDRRNVLVGPRQERGGTPPAGRIAPPRDRSVPERQQRENVRPERMQPRENVRPERMQPMERETPPGRRSEDRVPEMKGPPAERKTGATPAGRTGPVPRQEVRPESPSREEAGKAGPSGGGPKKEKAEKTEKQEGKERPSTQERAGKQEKAGKAEPQKGVVKPPPRSQERKERGEPSKNEEDQEREGRKPGRSR